MWMYCKSLLFYADKQIYLLDDGVKFSNDEIGISKRIGVESAGADGLLPHRFYIKGNPYVSGNNR